MTYCIPPRKYISHRTYMSLRTLLGHLFMWVVGICLGCLSNNVLVDESNGETTCERNVTTTYRGPRLGKGLTTYLLVPGERNVRHRRCIIAILHIVLAPCRYGARVRWAPDPRAAREGGLPWRHVRRRKVFGNSNALNYLTEVRGGDGWPTATYIIRCQVQDEICSGRLHVS